VRGRGLRRVRRLFTAHADSSRSPVMGRMIKPTHSGLLPNRSLRQDEVSLEKTSAAFVAGMGCDLQLASLFKGAILGLKSAGRLNIG